MPEIIKDSVFYKTDSGTISLPVELDETGKLIREGHPLDMGKRFVCASVFDIIDLNKKPVRIQLTGDYITVGGVSVNFGCGTEGLATKGSPNRVSCCDKYMSKVDPKPLPSSD